MMGVALCCACIIGTAAAGAQGGARLPASLRRRSNHTHEKDTVVITSISSSHLIDLLRGPADGEPNFLTRPTHGLPLHVYYNWAARRSPSDEEVVFRHSSVSKFYDLDVVQPWATPLVQRHLKREREFHEALWHQKLHPRQHRARGNGTWYASSTSTVAEVPKACLAPHAADAHGCNHLSRACIAPGHRLPTFLQAYNQSLDERERAQHRWPGCLDVYTVYKVAAVAHALGYVSLHTVGHAAGVSAHATGASAHTAGASAHESETTPAGGQALASPQAVIVLDSDAYIRAPLDDTFWAWTWQYHFVTIGVKDADPETGVMFLRASGATHDLMRLMIRAYVDEEWQQQQIRQHGLRGLNDIVLWRYFFESPAHASTLMARLKVGWFAVGCRDYTSAKRGSWPAWMVESHAYPTSNQQFYCPGEDDTICSPFNAFEYLIHSKGVGAKKARGSLSRYASFSSSGVDPGGSPENVTGGMQGSRA